jgi:predicted nucleic acid-binding protein
MTIGPRLAHQALALDNDVLNDWRVGKLATLQAIKDYIAATKVPPALTSLTVFEMMQGFEKASILSGGMSERTVQDKERARILTRDCVVLPFNEDAAEIAAYIFPRLSQRERNKHWADIFIAATALAHEYGVATRNRSDFELIAKHAPPHYPVLRIHVWK